MASPDYLICLECESPVYVFEWHDGKVTEAICTACGADDTAGFATPDEYEALATDDRYSEKE